MMQSWLKAARWRTVVIGVVCGGIVHIAATLLVPELATETAVQKLLAGLPANRMQVLAPVTAKQQPLPFMSPDTRYALCRFDVGAGPVSVSALLPDKGWSLELYTPEGDNFYAVPAQDLRKAEVSFLLVGQSEQPRSVLPAARAAIGTTVSQITVPKREGLIVVRANRRGQSYDGEIEAQLARASCVHAVADRPIAPDR